MRLMLLERDTFEPITVVEDFQSMIWTDRYCAAGDFELIVPASSEAASLFIPDRYLWNAESEHMMILEDTTIESDIEWGQTIKSTGRSLESLLDRRIIWTMVDMNGNLQTQLRDKVYNPNIISPKDTKRKIDNFVFQLSTDPIITAQTIKQQITGKDIYEITTSILGERDLGFKIILDKNNRFVMSFYSGTDRSYDNEEGNNYVIFSPYFENLINSNYFISSAAWKNAALVAGEDLTVSENRKTVEIPGSYTGIDRRELFVDARDIQSEIHNEDGTTTTLPTSEYNARLMSRGYGRLLENLYEEVFEAETDPSTTFIYGEDYFLGDIVQLRNEYGIERKVRVTEMVHSADNSGETVIPGFTIIE